MLAMEALGQGCRDQGLLFSLHAHMWAIETPLLAFGSGTQKERYLPKLGDGTWVGAHGMTEPESGSDAFGLRTEAVRRGDRYVLNGTKMFVTNAPVADLFLVFASVNRQRGMWGVTAFLIERGAKGLSVSKKIEKMGLSTSPMGEVVLEDCEVPAENMLGREGQGAAIFNHSMGWERSCILASTLGAMDRQLQACITYVKTRHQFGKPIGNFQLVASRIADMKVRLETSRLLLYRAAWSQAQGGMSALDAAMAKLYVSEAAVASALDAIQVHGGYGYTREFEVERDLRDMLGGRLYSGTSEIQKLIIARGLGLNPE
jgi:alkylation response protein AidB-like acyl-CoA dehydrogenase